MNNFEFHVKLFENTIEIIVDDIGNVLSKFNI